MVPCGDRSIPGIVGDYDPCSHLYETACYLSDSVRQCGGDRVSVSADLSNGTEWLVYGLGIPVVLLVRGGRSGDFCIRKLPMSFLGSFIPDLRSSSIVCGTGNSYRPFPGTGIELRWSAIVLTICGIVDITIATLFVPEKTAQCSTQTASFLTGGIYGTGREKTVKEQSESNATDRRARGLVENPDLEKHRQSQDHIGELLGNSKERFNTVRWILREWMRNGSA